MTRIVMFFFVRPASVEAELNPLSFNKRPKVYLNVSYSRGRTIVLIEYYLGFILFIILLGALLSFVNRRNDKKKLFED